MPADHSEGRGDVQLKSLKSMANALSEACLLIDLDEGRVLYSNRSARRLLSKSLDGRELAGMAVDPDRLAASLRLFASTTTAVVGRWRLQLGDRAVDLHVSGARLAAHGGLEPPCVLVTLRAQKSVGEGLFGELSTQLREIRQERHKLLQDNQALEALVAQRTASLAHKNAELDELNRSLDTFVSVVAHDLQAPARRLHIFTQLLEMQLGEEAISDDVTTTLETLREGSSRLTLMVQGMVKLSRLNKSDEAWALVSLDDLVDGIVRDLKAQHDGVAVTVEYADLGEVYGDPGQVHQLLFNLLNNAIKFRVPGAPATINVCTEVADNKDQVLLCVRDQGRGIHPGEFDRVLQPFTRGTGSEDSPGTGLGLSMCQRICQLHGGRLWIDKSVHVESDPASSTEFRLTLPRRRPVG